MMDYSVEFQKIHSDDLQLEYFLVPWDTDILGFPVAEISSIKLLNHQAGAASFSLFLNWCDDHEIRFCSSRIPQHCVAESFFLQSRGFRFIEVNYNPVLQELPAKKLPRDSLQVMRADLDDKDLLTSMAEQVFEYGRFHQDPDLGPEVGNRRYGTWMNNSFSHPDQVVYKCVDGAEVIAFFVVEYDGAGQCHWSLIGLAPHKTGQGLGTRVWLSMLRFHQMEGIQTITTSISSHNTAVFNLYVKLGFRFPAPKITYHWSR